MTCGQIFPALKTLIAPLLSASLLWGCPACAGEESGEKQEAVDTEHIFGFTEGADIGEKGEREIESTSVASFGKPGRYLAIENETAFRTVLSDSFRVSAGSLSDSHDIHDVPDLANRDAFDFAGATSEFRWHPVERTEAQPVGLSLSLMPEWRRIDDVSGVRAETYAAPIELLLDAELIPKKLFAAINVNYEPGVTRAPGGWEHGNALEISLAGAYELTSDLFAGAGIRRLGDGREGFFDAHALFAGPSVYYKFTGTFAIEAAWSEQIPDEATGRLDLKNYPRRQALLLLVKEF